MKKFLKIIGVLAFSIGLLEFMILARIRHWFEFTPIRVIGLTALAGGVYYLLFNLKRNKKDSR